MVQPRTTRSAGSRVRAVFVAAVFLLVVSISTIVIFYTDLLWFQEVGYESVFWKIFTSKVLLAAGLGVLFFVFLLLNLFIVGRMMPLWRLSVSGQDPLERYRSGVLPYLRWVAIGGSALLAVLFALSVTAEWDRFVLAMNSVPFGSTDQVFGRDLGFYVFKLPLYQFLYGWLFSSLVVVTLIVGGAHYLTGGIRPQAAAGRVSPQVKAHLSVLIGLLAALRAWGYRIDQFELLYSTRGDVTGASYTDINAELPALKLLVVISIIGAILFLVNIRFRGWTLPIAGVGLWLLTSVLAAGAFPFFIQRFSVEPAQLQKESRFIDRNIKATRAAYGLDRVGVTEYPAKTEVPAETIAANPATIKNIRLFDPEILKTAYRQLEEFRTYYEFDDVDVDRYVINGEKRQVMLSARELALSNLESLSWVNNHVFYTHGYGLVVSPTNEVSAEGRPNFIVRDIPPRSEAPELEIRQGGIYYGERIEDYSIVRTRQRELDFGQQEGNRFTRYQGEGGVPNDGLVRRLAFAWRFRNVNLLISGLIQDDSRLMYYRRIQERLTKAAPFLTFDGDPYPVIFDGKIVWMADGYTTSRMYPYSERIDFGSRTATNRGAGESSIPGIHNYIRNSVKATVDAYDGSIRFYVWDEQDPIIKAWQKAFPDLFLDGAQMPEGLRSHVRYPEDLFRIQTFAYTRYHVTDPEDFFTREDRWVIPKDPNVGSTEGTTAISQAEEIQPYYVLMKLPGAEKEEYVLILPMNPRDRPNMVSYLAAKSDPEDYGRLSDFRFPQTTTIFGVGQIHSRINQDPEFSRERTLLDREGSRLAFGNLLVVPIGESVLYVQPLFLRAERNAIPELKFVILATANRVVLADTLEEAIQKLVSGSALVPTGTPDSSESTEELVRQALDHLVKAEEAAKAGDWATYGAEQKAAKEALEEADKRDSSPSPSPSPTG